MTKSLMYTVAELIWLKTHGIKQYPITVQKNEIKRKFALSTIISIEYTANIQK